MNQTSANRRVQAAATPSEGVQMRAVIGIPDVKPGDNLSEQILSALQLSELSLKDGDILVIAHKIVSKSEGQISI